MPTFALKSRIRAVSDDCTLSLNIRHRLVANQPSDNLYDVKPTLPEGVDILLVSNLPVTISGILDGTRIMPEILKESRIACHLVEYLQMNAKEIGINAVSDLYISEDTGLVTPVSLTASRRFPLSADLLPVHVKLTGIDLDYVWRTTSTPDSAQPSSDLLDVATNPFSRHLSLPYLVLADNVIGRFATFQLVRRYPLIFGTWCQQLDIESQIFPSILASIQNIAERSPHPLFQETCQQMLKVCQRRITSAFEASTVALSTYLGSSEGRNMASEIPAYTESELFVLAMEGVYRSGLKRPLFKGIAHYRGDSDNEEDLLHKADDNTSLAEDLHSDMELLSDAPPRIPSPNLSLRWQTRRAGVERSTIPKTDIDFSRQDPRYKLKQLTESPDRVGRPLYFTPATNSDDDCWEQDDFSHVYETCLDCNASSGDAFGELSSNIIRQASQSSHVSTDSVMNHSEEDSEHVLNLQHDWSADDLPSQEKLEPQTMGMVLVGSGLSRVQPLKIPPSLTLPTTLKTFPESPNIGYINGGPPNLSPAYQDKPNNDNCTQVAMIPAVLSPSLGTQVVRGSEKIGEIALALPSSPCLDLVNDNDSDLELDLLSDLESDSGTNALLVNATDHGFMVFDGDLALTSPVSSKTAPGQPNTRYRARIPQERQCLYLDQMDSCAGLQISVGNEKSKTVEVFQDVDMCANDRNALIWKQHDGDYSFLVMEYDSDFAQET
ncbi:hypothetical protein B0H34DRAFT_807784 [Crassisporium funariophilum]|nr:hypothetical protein B0H34DRAFT_807784 [Crassisporium funariophilum]